MAMFRRGNDLRRAVFRVRKNHEVLLSVVRAFFDVLAIHGAAVCAVGVDAVCISEKGKEVFARRQRGGFFQVHARAVPRFRIQ